MLVVFD
jgi:hypothetical protein